MANYGSSKLEESIRHTVSHVDLEFPDVPGLQLPEVFSPLVVLARIPGSCSSRTPGDPKLGTSDSVAPLSYTEGTRRQRQARQGSEIQVVSEREREGKGEFEKWRFVRFYFL